MALELKQQLRLSQQLVMTPQLQQAIRLLQLNRLELVNVVQQELEENPVLEEAMEGEEEPVEAGPGQAVEEAPQPPSEAPAEDREPTNAEKIADVDWQNYIDAYPQTGVREARDSDDRPSFEATLTRRPTLSEHLRWQLQLMTFPLDEEAAAHFIIGNLDDRGYLMASTEELARQAGVSEQVVESALARVQDLDPAGVGARDLRECMRIQIRVLGIDDPIVTRIVDEKLDASGATSAGWPGNWASPSRTWPPLPRSSAGWSRGPAAPSGAMSPSTSYPTSTSTRWATIFTSSSTTTGCRACGSTTSTARCSPGTAPPRGTRRPTSTTRCARRCG
jgi:hypothetical protein